jgi:DNA-binding response OmpR family regulator
MIVMKQIIVVVEDDKAIRDMYTWKLEAEGFKVFGAENGQTGIALIEEVKPDLILLDIRMPIMNGNDMLEKLRSTDWGSSIRVIILTNLSKDEASHKLRLLNVDRYVVKAHSTPAQILSTINDVLGIKN